MRGFVNRWPSLPDDRCEVVLYTLEHDQTFPGQASTAPAVWSTQGRAHRGPGRPARRGLRAGVREPGRGGGRHHRPPARPDLRLRPGARRAAHRAAARHGASARYAPRSTRPSASPPPPGGTPGVPAASAYLYSLLLAPDVHRPDLPSLDGPQRDGLAELLVDVLGRLDRLFDIALHAVDPPAADRRRRLARGARPPPRDLADARRAFNATLPPPSSVAACSPTRSSPRTPPPHCESAASMGAGPGEPDRRPHRLHRAGWPCPWPSASAPRSPAIVGATG